MIHLRYVIVLLTAFTFALTQSYIKPLRIQGNQTLEYGLLAKFSNVFTV